MSKRGHSDQYLAQRAIARDVIEIVRQAIKDINNARSAPKIDSATAQHLHVRSLRLAKWLSSLDNWLTSLEYGTAEFEKPNRRLLDDHLEAISLRIAEIDALRDPHPSHSEIAAFIAKVENLLDQIRQFGGPHGPGGGPDD